MAMSDQSNCMMKRFIWKEGFDIYVCRQCLLKCCREHRNLHFVILPLLLAGHTSIKPTHTRLREARLSCSLWCWSLRGSFGFAQGAESDSVSE